MSSVSLRLGKMRAMRRMSDIAGHFVTVALDQRPPIAQLLAARLGAFVRSPQHQQLERHGTIGLDSGRIDRVINAHVGHDLVGTGDELVGGGNQAAACGDRPLIDRRAPGKLAIDQNCRRQRRERTQRRQFEVGQLLVGHRGLLILPEHGAHGLALVDGEHGEGARGAGQRIKWFRRGHGNLLHCVVEPGSTQSCAA